MTKLLMAVSLAVLVWPAFAIAAGEQSTPPAVVAALAPEASAPATLQSRPEIASDPYAMEEAAVIAEEIKAGGGCRRRVKSEDTVVLTD